MSVTASDRQAQAAAAAERERQMRQAEELLFSGPERPSFAKALFRGRFLGEIMFPFPEPSDAERAAADQAVEAVRRFADAHIDAAAIDRQADIPREVIHGLGELGVLGMTAPREYGGRGFTQAQYCRVMEVIGGHCSSTAVFVNAHHSIGIRALLLFGSDAQKSLWLTPLAKGEKLAGFALTEEQAGSDASNVQTQAVPTADGAGYIMNGSKRYITNGGIADVLTVMARTPDPAGGESKITAFLVTPDMPGFQVINGRMEKCGIRGTATATLAFRDMFVPKENILGPLGKGLRVALTVLDFGRTTFGASCTGASKACLAASVRHANRRRQFGRALADIDLVKKKIAFIAATTYAMESTTRQTAALIDMGAEDYMLETAILKVFATEALWESVYETLQIHGGQGYFTDEPYERMMRDARINTIGEGANEVLKSFIAMVGMRDVGMGLKNTLEGLKRPTKFLGTLFGFAEEHISRLSEPVSIPVAHPSLLEAAEGLAKRIGRFGWTIERTLVKHGEAILEAGLIHERIADAAIALHTSACTLARLDRELDAGLAAPGDESAARLYLAMAARRFDRALHDLGDNDDPTWIAAANAALGRA